MNRFVKKLLFLFALTAVVQASHSQGGVLRLSERDSLLFLLAYVENTVQEPAVKAVVQQTRKLATSNVPDSVLADYLLLMESSLIDLLKDFSFLNYKPFAWKHLLSLYQLTAALLQRFPLENENLYYAAAIHHLAALTIQFSAVSGHQVNTDSLMKTALEIRQKKLPPQHPDNVESVIGLAGALFNKGRIEETQHLLQTAILLSKGGESKAKRNYADALFLLAQVYRLQHRYPESTHLFEEEIAVRKEVLGAKNSRYALRMYYTSFMLLENLEYRKALQFATEALELTGSTLGSDNLQYAFCLEGVAAVHYRVGSYKDAVPYYEQSLAVKEKLFGKDYKDVSLTLHNLAKTYERMGLYEKALPLFQRATAIAGKAFQNGEEFDFNYGFALNNLAFLYQAMRQYEPAYALLQKAISLTFRSHTFDSTYYAMGLQNLALLFETTHQYDSALVYLNRVAAIRKLRWGAEHPEYATSLYSLSGIYAKKERIDTALLLAKKVVDIRAKKPGKKHAEYAAALNWLGELLTWDGRFDSAEQCLRQAMLIQVDVFGPDHPDYIKSLNILAKLALAKGDKHQAAALLTWAGKLWFHYLQRSSSSLSEKEKINLLTRAYDQFSYLPSLLYQYGLFYPGLLEQLYADELLLKGIVLDDQQQLLNSLRNSKDSSVTGFYLSWRSHRSLLANQYLLPPHKRLTSFDNLQENTTKLEQQLAGRSTHFRRQEGAGVSSLKQISAKLKRGEAAVEFIRFRLFRQQWTDSLLYAAIVILPDDTSGRFIPLFEERQLEKIVSSVGAVYSWNVKKLYAGNSAARSKKKSASLSNLVWQPLEKYLEGVHTVHVAPVGLLHRLSFAALCSSNGRRLVEKYNLHQVFSTRSLLQEKVEPAIPSTISLWGDIAYAKSKTTARSIQPTVASRDAEEGWPALPGTAKEIKSIEALCRKRGIRTEVIRGTMATEGSFKAYDGNSPGVLHIATHGLYQPVKNKLNGIIAGTDLISLSVTSDAMLSSGLLMAGCNQVPEPMEEFPSPEDGVLTAYEIAQMDLSKTSLVVLSACNTALGELQGNEGVIGLQRALRLAGVRQMIVSLWKVPDKETTEMMKLFYQHWLSGISIREALRTAQLRMKKKYPSPFYWAAFVLVE